MAYKAKVLADSTAHGVRITTIACTFPRFILAEVNTHRVFSRNSASSRAIPTEKLIERVREEPFIPETFNKRVKGMGVGAAFNELEQNEARSAWLDAAMSICDQAELLAEMEVDKSRANRLLEPFMWHTAIITSTEWSNFYGLRCPEGDEPDIEFPAQLEMQKIAIMMRNEMRESVPQRLGNGEWHRPLVDINVDGDAIYKQMKFDTDEQYSLALNQLSARRVARVSFDKHNESEPIADSIEKAEQLVTGGHWSPFEHIATPLTYGHFSQYPGKVLVPVDEINRAMLSGDPGYDSLREIRPANCWAGNLRGWFSFRKEFVGEEDHATVLDYEVM